MKVNSKYWLGLKLEGKGDLAWEDESFVKLPGFNTFR